MLGDRPSGAWTGSPRGSERGWRGRAMPASVNASPTSGRSVLDLQCIAVFRQVPESYIAFVEEFSGANTQGASLEEARTNLHEAIALVVGANRAFGLAPMEEPQ